MDDISNRPWLPSAILGAALCISALVVSHTFYSVRALSVGLEVTGSARKPVTADTIKWTGQFTRSVSRDVLQEGYALLKTDRAALTAFLKKNGITASGFTLSAVTMQPDWTQSGQAQNLMVLTQNVEVISTDVDKITQIAKNTDDVIKQGVLFSTQNLEYTISSLPEIRISLLNDAVKDARARAESIAKSDGKRVGKLLSADIGAVQVLAPKSVSVEDYGAYDTSSKEKEVMVTVHASFELR